MDLTRCMLRLAGEIDGRFIEYTSAISIITVPVEGCYCQNVIGQLAEKNGEPVLVFTSKVCELNAKEENHKVILKLNQELFYSRIIIQDWQLQVTAETLLLNCTEQLLKDMSNYSGCFFENIKIIKRIFYEYFQKSLPIMIIT